ncbi:hypothetical protein GCM10018793_18590 [Streptomyces sulfonofaciens]|uniref:Secreted protein n=1 Tax=Streptomyces sulfonofaciens TaxID=68272 RepID=A0A919FZH8_9ACTN|nr:hypothetical protein [Streptomyces sulfonofaciens]GHH75392.1 hypothetical protein GCM10018793_18590 [Streptomyces sulfonofaciens]
MQQSVVPELALAHTATRPIHWVATATAVAAVVALSGFLQPGAATATAARSGASATTKAAPHATALPAPDPGAVSYPLECGPAKALVQSSATGDLDGDGRPETLAVVHCDAGSGTPPDALYVLTAPADDQSAAARVVATLVDPGDRDTVTGLTVRNATVTATLLGYSSPDVPSCCPDQRQKAAWTWRDGAFRRSTPAQARTV